MNLAGSAYTCFPCRRSIAFLFRCFVSPHLPRCSGVSDQKVIAATCALRPDFGAIVTGHANVLLGIAHGAVGVVAYGWENPLFRRVYAELEAANGQADAPGVAAALENLGSQRALLVSPSPSSKEIIRKERKKERQRKQGNI